MDTFDPNKIYHEIIDAGNEWADYSAKANLLEETKKTLEAAITAEHIANGDSAAAASVKAKADERMKVHIEGMVEARRLSDRAKVRYTAVQELSQNRRTQTVNNREQMRAA